MAEDKQVPTTKPAPEKAPIPVYTVAPPTEAPTPHSPEQKEAARKATLTQEQLNAEAEEERKAKLTPEERKAEEKAKSEREAKEKEAEAKVAKVNANLTKDGSPNKISYQIRGGEIAYVWVNEVPTRILTEDEMAAVEDMKPATR